MSEKVTDEQASEALATLMATAGESDEPSTVEMSAPEPSAEPVAEPEPAQAEPVEQPPEPAAAAPNDDVESLKTRLSAAEARAAEIEKRAAERLAAINERHAANERIMRDRVLRKSSVADQALRVLKQTRTKEGASEIDVDRTISEIESSMNPASPSYVPPSPQRDLSIEDKTIILNGFLNERNMDAQEANEFGAWLQTKAATSMSPIEQEVAGRDLDAFLRIAHTRYAESMRAADQTKRHNDAVDAVRSVQRTQKVAARAAASSPAAPKKQVTGPKPIDVKKLTQDDISALLRQSVEQYR